MQNDWIKVDITTAGPGVEPLSAALMELGVPGIQVQDPRDIEDLLAKKGPYWDYLDEELLKQRDAETVVTFYLPQNAGGAETLAALGGELARLKALDAAGEWGRLEYALNGVNEEDWANNWKQYYHAAKIGERLAICPAWEDYAPAPGETVIRLEPGMAFGTGTHESTRLCLRLLEGCEAGGKRVLDLGCGSGVLGIAAALLGAKSVLGVDIDEVAVRVATENAALNNVADRCEFLRGGIPGIKGTYGVVFANIVADVIIGHTKYMADYLTEDGVLIVSGVIDTREAEVAEGLTAAGLKILDRLEDNGWAALVARRK